MTKLSRREFVKTTIVASAYINPVAAALDKYVGEGDKKISDLLTGYAGTNPEFHLIDNSLLNLHFYFLNAKKRHAELIPEILDRPSFMVVRLPQQHVSEAGFWQQNWADYKNDKPLAMLSGFSYLAFRVWPASEITKKHNKRHLKFTLENLLDWNNETHFSLITLIDWLQLKGDADSFKFVELIDHCDDFKKRKIWTTDQLHSGNPIQIDSTEPQGEIFRRYKSIVTTLFDANVDAKNKCFVPVTFFEVPHEVCLVPLLRKTATPVGPAVLKPRFRSNTLSPKVSKKQWTHKYEVWNNTLYYERTQPLGHDANQDKKFSFETPSFRIAGLITDRVPGCPTGQKPCASAECSVDPNHPDKIQDVLPTLLDKTELAYLTQFAAKRTDAAFDIKELNGFFFTGLGVITHLKYDTQKDLPPGIDLIEYEHQITEGRDVFIKVARLGYNSKTGQKYKHVIEATRKIPTEQKTDKDPPLASFLELKQYCECIEATIDYGLLPTSSDWNRQCFVKYRKTPSNEITKPVLTNDCHYRRLPFLSLTNTDNKRIPISCLRDTIEESKVCALEQLPWFWVIKETSYQDSSGSAIQDKDVPIESYVPCHYQASDWDHKSHRAATPFMFIRKCYIEKVASDTASADAAYDNYLKGDYKKAGAKDPLVERRLTYFDHDTISFTGMPTPPNGESVAYDSKTNTLETEYFESYFRIKDTSFRDDPDVDKSFGEKRYVIFPQILRARVFLDHIRDLAQKKLPSVVEFHPDYVHAGFDEYIGGTDRKNFGKLILQHTDAFRSEHEEERNNTYGVIKTALQQAKNALGNLAVPDIIPDAISLDQSGITLPPNMSEAADRGWATFDRQKEKLQALSPRALLRGQLSEILGGIDLTAILNELLPQEDSPLFELTKLANELEKIEKEIVESPVYKEILHDLDALKAAIDKAVTEVNGLLTQIRDAREVLNAALLKISSQVPNVDELDSIVKNLFERYRLRVFSVLVENVDFTAVAQVIQDSEKKVNTFLAQELPILKKLDYEPKLDQLNAFFATVQAELNVLPNELKLIGGKDPGTYFKEQLACLYKRVVDGYADSAGVLRPFNDLQGKMASLFRTVADNLPVTVDGVQVLYKLRSNSSMTFDGYATPTAAIDWELTDKPGADTKPLFSLNTGDPGYIQLKKKVEDFKAFIAGNLQSADAFQKKAVGELSRLTAIHEAKLRDAQAMVEAFQITVLERISANIRDWNDRAEAFRQAANPPEAKEIVKRVQELVLKGNSYVDFLRKSDPYFYYVQRERLSKDIDDIKRRFFDALSRIYGPDKEFGSCPPPAGNNCPPPPAFSSITEHVQHCVCVYECTRQKLFEYVTDPTKKESLKEYVKQFECDVQKPLNGITAKVVEAIQADPNYQYLQEAYEQVKLATSKIAEAQKLYETSYKKYLDLVRSQAKATGEELAKTVQTYIEKKEAELVAAVDPVVIRDAQNSIDEARNIYRVLTAIKQQNLTYTWSTSGFRDASLGILTFKKGSDPDTKLTVDVSTTTYFSPGKFPPAVERVDTSSSNRITNFAVGFFGVLTVGFSEVSFQAQSGQSPHFAVKIKDVKFDGALAFVQEFEKWLANKGLILNIGADHLGLGYSLQLPSIQTPAFAFFNLTLNFDIRLYFDNRPMRFGFSFARPDLKFGIAAGIYAGFGFFGLVGEPKRGIVEMDAALEAGAWKAITIGPIKGEVKLAFGFRYTRNDAGVRLEGYVVAEGRLSVWIIEVAARIYLGVVSENSYVEGQCTVTYSAKLGFISKSFSGTFHQKIAGAESKNHDQNARTMLKYHQSLCAFLGTPRISKSSAELYQGYVQYLNRAENALEEPETFAVSRASWNKFARVM